ncbi:MAG: flippase [archaeon]
MSEHVKKVFSGAVVIFAFLILSNIIAYLIRVIYARTLTPAEYGLFYAVLGFLNFFIIFRDLGLSETLIKYIPEFELKNDKSKIKSAIVLVCIVQFGMSILFVSAFFLLSDFLAVNYIKGVDASLYSTVSSIIKIVGLSFLVDGFGEVIVNSLNGLQKTKYYALEDFLRNLATLIIVLLLINHIDNVNIPAFAQLGAFAITCIVMIVLFLKSFDFFKYKINIDKKLIKLMFSYSLKILIGTGAGIMIGYASTIILTVFAGVESVGIFNVALPTSMLLFIFSRPFGQILSPMASELWAKNEKEKIKEILSLVYHYLFILILPIVMTFISYPDLIIRIVFGSKYLASHLSIFGQSISQASLAMQILAGGMIFLVFAQINFGVIASIGKPLLRTKAAYVSAITGIICALLLVPTIGVVGAAIATAISNAVLYLMSHIYIKKIVQSLLPLKSWLKTIIAGIIYIIIVQITKNILIMPVYIETSLIIGVSGIFYLWLLILFKQINVKIVRDFVFEIIKKY